jgi:rare lipoprotein A
MLTTGFVKSTTFENMGDPAMRARRRLRTALFITSVCAIASVGNTQSASADKLSSSSATPIGHRHAIVERQALRNHLFANRHAGIPSGIASTYSGGKTASGERMNPSELTAAHPTLPFGSKITVTNPHTGRSVVVRINDRGPFVKGRVIDLSPAAARAIGVNGLAQVSLSAN